MARLAKFCARLPAENRSWYATGQMSNLCIEFFVVLVDSLFDEN